jgi:hypothetical protein
MLKIAIDVIANDSDFAFNLLRKSVNQVLQGNVSRNTIDKYFLAKKVHQQEIDLHNRNNGISSEEQLSYDMLEMCLFFDNDDVEYCTANELANVLRVDSSLRKYSEEHVLHDGIWGALKFKIPITTKTDVILDAINLV